VPGPLVPPSALLPPPALPALPAAAPAVAPGAAERTEAARAVLSRARLRGVPVNDVVVFVAACPGCGRDAQWQEEREDTRLRATVTCAC